MFGQRGWRIVRGLSTGKRQGKCSKEISKEYFWRECVDPMRDVKSLREVVITCATLVDTNTHIHTGPDLHIWGP